MNAESTPVLCDHHLSSATYRLMHFSATTWKRNLAQGSQLKSAHSGSQRSPLSIEFYWSNPTKSGLRGLLFVCTFLLVKPTCCWFYPTFCKFTSLSLTLCPFWVDEKSWVRQVGPLIHFIQSIVKLVWNSSERRNNNSLIGEVRQGGRCNFPVEFTPVAIRLMCSPPLRALVGKYGIPSWRRRSQHNRNLTKFPLPRKSVL